MVKNINIKQTSTKKIVKIILIILMTPIILFAIFIALYFGTKPIFDKIDHDKFDTLNSQTYSLFQKIDTASNGNDDWKYSDVCISDRTGWMETGVYHCVTSISTQKNIKSVQELSELHNKYYPIIENSDIWKQQNSTNIQTSTDFSKKFVVSLAYKDYTEEKTNTKCTYTIQLNQTAANKNYDTGNYNLGSEIDGSEGSFLISLRCSGTARSHWYELSDSANLLIP